MHVIRQSGLTPAPWKNGGGVTREAWRWPQGAESYGWRLSFAQVETSGPFSDFSGYTRYLVLLRGAGVRLEFADGASQTLREPGDLAQFDGGLATRGVLLQGSCADLNLIVARRGYCARVRVASLGHPLTEAPAAGETRLVVPIDAPLCVTDTAGTVARLEPGDIAIGQVLRLAPESPCRVFIAGIADNAP
jgi:environmental stress-induced protein Ves